MIYNAIGDNYQYSLERMMQYLGPSLRGILGIFSLESCISNPQLHSYVIPGEAY